MQYCNYISILNTIKQEMAIVRSLILSNLQKAASVFLEPLNLGVLSLPYSVMIITGNY